MDDLRLAHELADEAARVSMAWFGTAVAARAKADGSIVTDADEAVEDALRALLASRRPTDAIVGEERGHTGSGERVWFLDGIDGTDSFAARGREWGTLIALQISGEVVVGVADAPVVGRRAWAAKGSGAFLTGQPGGVDPKRLQVSAEEMLGRCRCVVPPLRWCRDQHERDAVERVRRSTLPVGVSDHPAVAVAAGDCDAALFYWTGPWDVAAPSLIVDETGGRWSDLDGTRRMDAGGVLYSNGLLHDQLLDLLNP